MACGSTHRAYPLGRVGPHPAAPCWELGGGGKVAITSGVCGPLLSSEGGMGVCTQGVHACAGWGR